MTLRQCLSRECLSGKFLATRPSAPFKAVPPHIQILKITIKLDRDCPHTKRTHFILMQVAECLRSFPKDCSKFQNMEVVRVVGCFKLDQRSLEMEATASATSVKLSASLAGFEMIPNKTWNTVAEKASSKVTLRLKTLVVLLSDACRKSTYLPILVIGDTNVDWGLFSTARHQYSPGGFCTDGGLRRILPRSANRSLR
jgi:hypothetical protein